MPVVWIKDIAHHTRLGLWKICKDEQLESTCPPIARLESSGKCDTRRMEIMATYALLHEITGRNDLIINHEPSGKPYIQDATHQMSNHHVSISHTHSYACIIISEERQVAVDMEYYSNRVNRIMGRFLRQDEIHKIESNENNMGSTRLTCLLLHWCAKETTYKFYSDKSLTFQNMRVEGIEDIMEQGQYQCVNLLNNEPLTINYMLENDIVITYS